jgi:subtilisin family serine protease
MLNLCLFLFAYTQYVVKDTTGKTTTKDVSLPTNVSPGSTILIETSKNNYISNRLLLKPHHINDLQNISETYKLSIKQKTKDETFVLVGHSAPSLLSFETRITNDPRIEFAEIMKTSDVVIKNKLKVPQRKLSDNSQQCECADYNHGCLSDGYDVSERCGCFDHLEVYKRISSCSGGSAASCQQTYDSWFDSNFPTNLFCYVRNSSNCSPDEIFSSEFIPNGFYKSCLSDYPVSEPLAWKQYHLQKINVPLDNPYITGNGIVVSVIDDSCELTHPDLNILDFTYCDNSCASSNNGVCEDPGVCATGTDCNDCGVANYHHDILPNDSNDHGTACAGVIAAKRNGAGVSGIAYNAQLVGHRILDGYGIDGSEEQAAFSEYNNGAPNTPNSPWVHIKSNSWGPGDDPDTYGKPSSMGNAALIDGVTNGRGGKGTIYVWASGNGGYEMNNCNWDGYSSSPYTIAVTAVNPLLRKSWYGEECAAHIVSAPSNDAAGNMGTSNLQTSDYSNYNLPAGTFGYGYGITTTKAYAGYESTFGGTSAACPVVSGVIALLLSAHPELGWRDVQEILMRSATKNHPTHPDWIVNAAGINYNHFYGAGVVNGKQAISLASTWTNLGNRLTKTYETLNINSPMPDLFDETYYISVSDTVRVEHVQITINIRHQFRHDLLITLKSPSGTLSRLTTPLSTSTTHPDFGHNILDGYCNPISYCSWPTDDLGRWTFSTVMMWGENSVGAWELHIQDLYTGNDVSTNEIRSYTLVFSGTEIPPSNVLCLSGGGQPKESFETALSAYTVSSKCVYLNGNISGFLWHEDYNKNNLPGPPDTSAIQYLDNYFTASTVGMIGYSQGCAAMLGYVAKLFEESRVLNLEFVVCLNGYLPYDLQGVQSRIQAQIPINMSSLTFVSDNDSILGDLTSAVPAIFAGPQVITASYDHGFPQSTSDAHFDDIEAFINAFIITSPPPPPPSPPPRSPPPAPPPITDATQCTSFNLCCVIIYNHASGVQCQPVPIFDLTNWTAPTSNSLNLENRCGETIYDWLTYNLNWDFDPETSTTIPDGGVQVGFHVDPICPSPSPPPPLPPHPPPPRTVCLESCPDHPDYTSDGYCDDGGPGSQFDFCPCGNDCADCGPRPEQSCGIYRSPAPPPPPPSPSPPPSPFPPPPSSPPPPLPPHSPPSHPPPIPSSPPPQFPPSAPILSPFSPSPPPTYSTFNVFWKNGLGADVSNGGVL